MKDTIALAKFYQSAFGMQEVNRIQNPGGTEVFMNFGSTVAAVQAAGGTMPVTRGSSAIPGLSSASRSIRLDNRIDLIHRP
ncbi:MAG: hypothetical protein WBE37_27895 [Bryobacteraceae bacterium]